MINRTRTVKDLAPKTVFKRRQKNIEAEADKKVNILSHLFHFVNEILKFDYVELAMM